MQDKFNSGNHFISKNRNGNIDTVLVGEKITLETSVGDLVPRFTIKDDAGRRKEAPVKFYKSGELKSVPLEEMTDIPTSIGKIKSELAIFYKSGALLRVFPLNGQVTGFWTEEDEYKLAETIAIPTPLGAIEVKPIYIQFYETGELESVLFWPNEQMSIKTAMGDIAIRKGICFHKNGKIKGFEPVEEIVVDSPIGKMKVYDPDPNGMQAETHSLNFKEDGSVQSVITSSNQVTALKDGEEYRLFSPKTIMSYCNEDDFFVSPMKVAFDDDSISFNNMNEPVEALPISLDFKISAFVPDAPVTVFGCS